MWVCYNYHRYMYMHTHIQCAFIYYHSNTFTLHCLDRELPQYRFICIYTQIDQWPYLLFVGMMR